MKRGTTSSPEMAERYEHATNAAILTHFCFVVLVYITSSFFHWSIFDGDEKSGISSS